MNKIEAIKAIREIKCLKADLLECKQFVDKHYQEPFVENLKAEISSVGGYHGDCKYTQVLTLQASLNSQIYLTGSRFFGTATDKSDFDFFVQYEQNIGLTLARFGFDKLHHMSSYLDKDCESVWLHQTYPIHIQLSYDVLRRLRARNLLKAGLGNINGLNKQLRSDLWNKLL